MIWSDWEILTSSSFSNLVSSLLSTCCTPRPTWRASARPSTCSTSKPLRRRWEWKTSCKSTKTNLTWWKRSSSWSRRLFRLMSTWWNCPVRHQSRSLSAFIVASSLCQEPISNVITLRAIPLKTTIETSQMLSMIRWRGNPHRSCNRKMKSSKKSTRRRSFKR